MKNDFIIGFLIKLIVFVSLARSQSPCLNLGQYNKTTERCSCFPGYSGEFCQYVDCSKQSLQCANYTSTFCVYSTVATYCPELCNNAICRCGFKQCLNGGRFNASDCSCRCPEGYFGTTCETTNPVLPVVCAPPEQYNCQNQGIFNNLTCGCNCFPSYSGQYCETLMCDNPDPATCQGYNNTLCSLSLVNSYCPHLCELCPSSSTSNPSSDSTSNLTLAPAPAQVSLPARVSVCSKTLNCRNSGVFSNSSCSCQCFPSYKGESCESLDCSVPDPQQCLNYTQAQCALRLVYNFCPQLCGKCPSVEDPACPYRQCLGGYFSNSSCSCRCYPNWSGELCDQLTCDSAIEPLVCAGYTPNHCNYQEIYEYCPLLCGLCNQTGENPTSLSPTSVKPTSENPTSVKPTSASSTKSPTQTTSPTDTTPSSVSPITSPNKLQNAQDDQDTTPCTPVSSCFNGGQISSSDPCQCQCYPGFFGPMCEKINCPTVDPKDCSSVVSNPTTQCVLSFIYSSACPFKCGLCTKPGETVNTLALVSPVTAAPACLPLKCASGVTFNPVTCLCPCPTGFTDDVCSVYDCELGVKDSVECYGMDCSAPGSSIICPQTCFNCPNPLDESR